MDIGEAVLKQIMPQSIETEKSVIGSMLKSKDAIVEAAGILNPEDFYARQHEILFRAIVELDALGKNADIVTISDHISKMKDVPESVTSMEFLGEIFETSCNASNVTNYAEIVKGKAVLRKLIRLTDEISKMCYEGKSSVEYVLDETEKKVFNLVQNRST